MSMGKSLRVYDRDKGPYSIIIEHRLRDKCLLFQSETIQILEPDEKDSMKRDYTKILDAYGLLGLLKIESNNFLVLVTGCISLGKIGDLEIFRITQTSFISTKKQEDDISEVKKLLNSGTFYFGWSSEGGDVTLCAQRKALTHETDNRFLWNRTLVLPLVRYGIGWEWYLKIICGSVEIRTVYVGARQGKAVMISRVSNERTGTRFHVRGVDDEGYVANFVETEQAIFMEDSISSYVQIRGSVPFFWEQTGVQVGQHRVRLSREPETSTAAFRRHLNLLRRLYGQLTIVNLLSTSLTTKESEGTLSNLYQTYLKSAGLDGIAFDYHQEVKQDKTLAKLVRELESHFKSFNIFYSQGGQVQLEQSGVIRTNCLDCLDRTNCVQTMIGVKVLNRQLEALGLDDRQPTARFEEVFKQMWICNGNEVSRIYAGTGAIQGGSKLMDGARSAARTIQNNLLDGSKQEAIELLLGVVDERSKALLPSYMWHLPDRLANRLNESHFKFTTNKMAKIGVGTYNVNGGRHFRSVVFKDSLSDWFGDIPCDIYAVGFQELVDLNASNIVAASSENAKTWAQELKRLLPDRKLVTYVQLVGVCLYLFVSSEIAENMRDVSVDTVKTGFGGTTGNKGAVYIRATFYNTSFTFVCAHFAAGQSQTEERNSDYTEIVKKLRASDYTIFAGDLNYRLDTDNAEIRSSVKEGKFSDLLRHDQLLVQKGLGQVFDLYHEGEITFAPTYKYDLFSDDYDTSDKMRSPAWTDRVLFKRSYRSGRELSNDKFIYYGRAELKQSDHRPVFAIIQVELSKVDSDRLDRIFDEIVEDSGPLDATILVDTTSDLTDEDFKMNLLENLSQFGEVLVLRQMNDSIKVVYGDGFSAKVAFESLSTLNDSILSVRYPRDDWKSMIGDELRLTLNNTIPIVRPRSKPPPRPKALNPPQHPPPVPPRSNIPPPIPSRPK